MSLFCSKQTSNEITRILAETVYQGAQHHASAVDLAARKGHIEVIKVIDRVARGSFSYSACIAARERQLCVVKYVFENQVNFEKPNYELLVAACLGGCLQIVEYLMINTQIDKSHRMNDGFMSQICEERWQSGHYRFV